MSKVAVKSLKDTKCNAYDDNEIDDNNKVGSYINKLVIKECNDNRTAIYPKPIIKGSYGVCNNKKTCERTYKKGSAYLKYLSLPPSPWSCHFDLNEGFDKEIKNRVSHELDLLLGWIVENKNKFVDQSKSDSLGIDFVCYRGTLSKIMLTPYDANTDWLVYAMKYKNTIYLRQALTELQETKYENMSLDELRCSHGGNRFEEYICVFVDPEVNDSSFMSHQFCCVFKSRFNAHSFLIAAEVDGVETKNQIKASLESMNFVEVKTCSRKCYYTNLCKYKMLRWWAQCSLVGIEKVVCGRRDQNLIVNKIRQYSLNKILEVGRKYWSPNVCLNFLDKVLTFVKDCVSEENVLYSFYCSLNEDIVCRKEFNTKCEVIPDWYKNSFVVSSEQSSINLSQLYNKKCKR